MQLEVYRCGSVVEYFWAVVNRSHNSTQRPTEEQAHGKLLRIHQGRGCVLRLASSVQHTTDLVQRRSVGFWQRCYRLCAPELISCSLLDRVAVRAEFSTIPTQS